MNYQDLLDSETKRLDAINNVNAEKKRNKAELVMETLTKLEDFFDFLNNKYNFRNGAQTHMVSGGMANLEFNKDRFKDKTSATFGLFTELIVISVTDNFEVKINYGYMNSDRIEHSIEGLINTVIKKIAAYNDLINRGGIHSTKLSEK